MTDYAQDLGVYPSYEPTETEHKGDEVSSTYEGRHLQIAANLLACPTGTVVKGDPVVVLDGAGDCVGVAFNAEDATGTNYIAIDTEGIWELLVSAEDDELAGSAVVPGNAIYININDGNCELSKKIDPEANTLFGYALGYVTASQTGIIAVKVHWGPSEDHIFLGKVTHYVEDATGLPRVEINSDFTGATGEGHDVIKASMSFLPDSDTGWGWHNVVNFNMVLGAGDTFTGGQGKLCGVAASITFEDASTVNQVSSIFCALRGTIRMVTTPIFTTFESITGLLIDVVGSVDLSNIAGTFNSSGIYFMNPSDTAFIDSCMHIYGGAWDNLFNFDGAQRGGNQGIIHGSGGFDGGHFEASVLIDGVEHRIRIYKPD